MNAGSSGYLDSSALAKLILDEPGKDALIALLSTLNRLYSCDLARVEVIRAVRLHRPAALPQAEHALNSLNLLALSDGTLTLAAAVDPPILRTLDAIHLAAALTVSPLIDVFITYDQRQAEAARAVGLQVSSPGAA